MPAGAELCTAGLRSGHLITGSSEYQAVRSLTMAGNDPLCLLDPRLQGGH
jgi:hypothetical protein